MAVTKLYDKYFQKSRAFLYPLLGIKKSANISPVNTYVSWRGLYTTDDMKLVVVYKQDNTEGFRLFEKTVLFKNRFFVDFKECEDGYTAYIFTFESFKEDWFRFLNGKYSQLSPDLKNRIKSYHGEGSGEWTYIESFLYPNKHYERYAELLADPADQAGMLDLLKRVGELCNPYDEERELLQIGIKYLELSENFN